MKTKIRAFGVVVSALVFVFLGCNQGAEQKKEGPASSKSSVQEGEPPSALAGIKQEVKETTDKVVEKVEEATEKVAENIEEKKRPGCGHDQQTGQQRRAPGSY